MTNEAETGPGMGPTPGGSTPKASAPDASGASAPRPRPGDDRKPAAGGAGASVRPARSRVGGLALLLAAVAIAGVGYLYWQTRTAGLAGDARLAELESRIAAVGARIDAQGAGSPEALRQEIERVAADLRAELDQRLPAAGTGSGSAAPAPATPRDWQVAEVRYLLRMANHRLLLERDVAGATALLRSADAVLAGLEDFALHDLRARIAEEVLALESVPAVDSEGLFLQIEAIKRDLDRLPARLPEFVPPPVEPVATEGVWAALRAELARLVQFRRFERTVRPLLAPEEAVYLELNLRLMLERAQLAGLRGEQTIYEQSIDTASGWIERYLDVTTPEVARVLEGLRALARVDLARPLPDISGSLNALDAAVRPVP